MVLGVPKLYPTLPLLSEPKLFHLNFSGVLVGDWGKNFFFFMALGEQALALSLLLVASPLSF